MDNTLRVDVKGMEALQERGERVGRGGGRNSLLQGCDVTRIEKELFESNAM